MRQVLEITDSFIQDQRHVTKSERFVAIQPLHIAEVLKDSGFSLVALKSGKAKSSDRASHQTTIARYRSDVELKINGLHMDLVFKVPHLYGALEAFLGTFRQVCSNGLVVGTKFFEGPRIRHSTSGLSQLNKLIPAMIAKHNELVEFIQVMQSKDVNPQAVAEFVRAAAKLRLKDVKNVSEVNFNDLMRVRRDADTGSDAFTVFNVVQENLMRYGMRYAIQTVNPETQAFETRNMTTRPLLTTRAGQGESIRSVDVNASLWDLASGILLAA
jgi:Domain of unknown function (DUF932)